MTRNATGGGWSSTRTNADGRIDVVTDKARPLEIEVAQAGFRTQLLELSAADLEGEGTIDIELEEVRPATLEIVPGEAGWPAGVGHDLFLYDLGALAKTRAEVEAQRGSFSMRMGSSVRLMHAPDGASQLEIEEQANGTWLIDAIPPGHYFLRIVAVSANPDLPCFYLPLGFELELEPEAYRTLTWAPALGGELHLDLQGSGKGVAASLLDPRGEACALTFWRQEDTGLMDHTSGPWPLPGKSRPSQALPAGQYTLRFDEPSGRHDLALTIEKGRVTTLEVDLDEL